MFINTGCASASDPDLEFFPKGPFCSFCGWSRHDFGLTVKIMLTTEALQVIHASKVEEI
jgi:hypothetical protein